MKLIVFSKSLKDKSLEELIELGQRLEIDGYDLCVRPGYPVNPDNAAEVFQALAAFHRDGGTVLVVTHGTAADEHADRIIHLQQGRIQEQGSDAPPLPGSQRVE